MTQEAIKQAIEKIDGKNTKLQEEMKGVSASMKELEGALEKLKSSGASFDSRGPPAAAPAESSIPTSAIKSKEEVPEEKEENAGSPEKVDEQEEKKTPEEDMEGDKSPDGEVPGSMADGAGDGSQVDFNMGNFGGGGMTEEEQKVLEERLDKMQA